jgi:hypothetical protein
MPEQVGVDPQELRRGLAGIPPHALVDEREIGPGERLVEELRSAKGRREPPQRAAEVDRRLGEVGVAGKIDEGGADVLAMTIGGLVEAGRFEERVELVVRELLAVRPALGR